MKTKESLTLFTQRHQLNKIHCMPCEPKCSWVAFISSNVCVCADIHGWLGACVCVCIHTYLYTYLICIYKHIYLNIRYFLNQVSFPDISYSGSLFDSGDDRVPPTPLPHFSIVSEKNLPDSKVEITWCGNHRLIIVVVGYIHKWFLISLIVLFACFNQSYKQNNPLWM